MKMMIAILGCLSIFSSFSFAQEKVSISCWDLDGSKMVVDTLNPGKNTCEENGYLSYRPKPLDCTPVSGEVLTEPTTYTKMVYTCGNLKNSPRKSITCKGNWVGDFKGCMENRFLLSEWLREFEEKDLKSGDKTRRQQDKGSKTDATR